MRRLPANLRASAAAVAAAALVAGCGAARRDAGGPRGTFAVAVERASFPPEQRLAKRATLELRVRNAGDAAIPDLVVTVRGFTDRAGGPRNADPARDLWIVDRDPVAARTAFEDTWATGRLGPGRTATLRWELTPVVAGRHRVSYAIAPADSGGARAVLAGGGAPRGTLAVRVSAHPATARVDPGSGRVIREE